MHSSGCLETIYRERDREVPPSRMSQPGPIANSQRPTTNDRLLVVGENDRYLNKPPYKLESCMRNIRVSLLSLALLAPVCARAQSDKLNKYGNPARITPAPTTAAITAHDLQIRLYQFSDDSMQGRQVGRVGNMKGTAYIASEVKRLGLQPAGDNGTYFQVLPYHLHSFTSHSRLTVNGNPLTWQQDWVAAAGARAPRPISTADVIFGGITGDTTTQISAAQANGKFVVLLPASPQAAPAGGRGGGGRGGFGGPS